MSLYLSFKNIAIHNKEKPAFVFKNKTYSYHDALNLIDVLENNLINQLHIHSHNVISVYLNDSFFSICLVYALNKIGAIINLIDINLSVEEAIFFAKKVKSRFVFIEKNLFYKSNKFLKNDLNILIPIDSNYPSKYKRYLIDFIDKIKYLKSIKPAINFVIKQIDNVISLKVEYNPNDIALIGGNERYLEPPHICCFSNYNIFSSYQNLNSILDLKKCEKVFLNFNGLKVSDFINFIHYPLLKLNTIFLKDGSIKRIPTYIKHNNIDYVFSKEPIFLTSNIQTLFLYNYLDDLSIYKNSNFSIKCLLGCVETLGCFAYKNNNENSFVIGKDFQIKKVHKNMYNKILDNKKCILFLKSNTNMVGYYKETQINDTIFKDGYLDTKLNITFTNNDRFMLNDDINWIGNNVYYHYIKDIFLTIPGIKSIDFKNDNKTKTTKIKIACHTQNKDYIKKEISEYLKVHFKDKNISYDINE